MDSLKGVALCYVYQHPHNIHTDRNHTYKGCQDENVNTNKNKRKQIFSTSPTNYSKPCIVLTFLWPLL